MTGQVSNSPGNSNKTLIGAAGLVLLAGLAAVGLPLFLILVWPKILLSVLGEEGFALVADWGGVVGLVLGTVAMVVVIRSALRDGARRIERPE